MTLREKLLRNNLFAEKVVSVRIPPTPDAEPGTGAEEVSLLIRQPTVGQRSEIMAQMKVGRDGELRAGDGLSRGLALGIIFCVLDPSSRRPVFDLADLDSLIGQPAGSWFDGLAADVMGLMSDTDALSKK